MSDIKDTMLNIWDERYSNAEYAYGVLPNVFFAEQIAHLNPGNILLTAEGEGRNAVFAALNGWHVSAFDISKAGKEKAALLAKQNHVMISYELCDFESYQAPHRFFDCVGMIYNHFPSAERSAFFQKICQILKPGGKIILEGFAVEQLGLTSGGPKDPDWLYTIEGLKSDFKALSHIEIAQKEIILNEGPFHQGPAQVIQMVGTC